MSLFTRQLGRVGFECFRVRAVSNARLGRVDKFINNLGNVLVFDVAGRSVRRNV